MAEQIKLPNGLQILWQKTPLEYSAAIGIWVKSGAALEDQNIKGVAHYLEHMLFKGSKKFSQKDIKKEIEGRGGQMNAFTSQEITCYFAQVSFANLFRTTQVLLNMVFHPLLRTLDIEKERGVILEEIKMYRDMPSQRTLALLDSLLWPGLPLGKEIIGEEESVRRIQKKDLLAFKEAFYVPANMAITIVSHKYPQQIINLIKKETALALRKNNFLPKAASWRGKKEAFKEELTSFQQTHLALGFRTFGYLAKEKYLLKILHVVLGANMSSRLFESLREKRGLCYEVSSSLKQYKSSGAFIIHAGLEAKNTLAALKIILGELKKLKTKKISLSELKRAKEYFLGSFFMGQEMPQDLMFYLGENACYGYKDYSPQRVAEAVKKIEPQHLQSVVQDLFTKEKLKVALVSHQSFKDKICAFIDKADF